MKSKMRLLIANSNSESLKILKKLLAPYHDIKLIGEVQHSNDAIDMALYFKPDVVLLDLNVGNEDAFQVVTEINRIAPYISVVLMGNAHSVQCFKKAMQAGAGDFLEPPYTAEGIYQSVYKLFTTKQKQKDYLQANPLVIPQRQPKVISFYGSKGVGKTLLAINTAVGLRELTRDDVLLTDMDLQLGDVSYNLGIQTVTSLFDLLADKENINTNNLGKYLYDHNLGIKILAAPQENLDTQEIDLADIIKLISVFRSIFDYVVIDLPPLIDEMALEVMKRSDLLLLVTNMEVPSIKKTREVLDILRQFSLDERIQFIVNRYQPDSQVKLEEIKNFLGIERHYLLNDCTEMVNQSFITGEPLVLVKETKVSKQLFELCTCIRDSNFPKNQEKKRSFFQWLLKKGGVDR